MTTALSILVCSIHTRYRGFALRLQDQLWTQYEQLPQESKDRVEILVLTDNKLMSIGEKRTALALTARGQYVQFIDDDDRIADDYIATMLDATLLDSFDVIAPLASVTLEGGPPRICRYSKDFRCDYNTDDEYHRIPNHICAVKRDIALTAGWGIINYGEDADYSKRLLPLLETEYQVGRVLYYYDYCRATSESRR